MRAGRNQLMFSRQWKGGSFAVLFAFLFPGILLSNDRDRQTAQQARLDSARSACVKAVSPKKERLPLAGSSCGGCYAKLMEWMTCQTANGGECTIYTCTGGSGHCAFGCGLNMVAMPQECANAGCGYTQPRCINESCSCFDDW
jgi:hypothetical protein